MTLPFADSASNELPELKNLVTKLMNGGATIKDVLDQADKVSPLEFLSAIRPVTHTFTDRRSHLHWTDASKEELSKYVVRRIPIAEDASPVELIAAASYFESFKNEPLMQATATGYIEQSKHNLDEEYPTLDGWTSLIVELVESHTHPETEHLDMGRKSTQFLAAIYEDVLKRQVYEHRAVLQRYGDDSPQREKSSERHQLLHAQYFAICNGYENHGLGHSADIISRVVDDTQIDETTMVFGEMDALAKDYSTHVPAGHHLK